MAKNPAYPVTNVSPAISTTHAPSEYAQQANIDSMHDKAAASKQAHKDTVHAAGMKKSPVMKPTKWPC